MVQVSVSTPEGERTSVTNNRLLGYPNLRQDTNISGNMGTPGYPILRDTHISVTPVVGRVSRVVAGQR